MNLRAVIFAALALVAGTATMVMMRSNLATRTVNPAVGETQTADAGSVEILVAGDTLPAGHFVKPESLRWQAWPRKNLSDSYIRKDAENPTQQSAFDGAVVRSRLTAGEPVTAERLIKPDDRGFLAAVLEPGQRAIGVAVEADSGVGGLVFPGDRVDVIMTHDLKDQAGNISRKASETVLRDVRVVAVDQKTDEPKDEEKDKLVVAKTVTLEVSPKQAETLTLSKQIGLLSLSLRSLAQTTPEGLMLTEPVTVGKASFTLDSDVSPLLIEAVNPSTAPPKKITILRGGKEMESFEVAR